MAMSLAWVVNRKLPKALPISGSVAVVAGLFVVPVSVFIRSGSISLGAASRFLLLEVLCVLPCLLLAIYLVRFHLGGMKKDAFTKQVVAG
jgi:uncharacterized membrane protein YqaE (UPF0057 family)